MTTTAPTQLNPTGPGPRPRRRGRTLALIAAPTILVLAGGGIAYAVLSDTPETPTTAPIAPAATDAASAPAAQPEASAEAAPAPLTPEEQAAADVEARYYEFTAVDSQHVEDPPDRFYPDGLPIDTVTAGLYREGTVTAYNDVALTEQPLQSIVGPIEVVALEINSVDLFTEPRLVEERADVAGLATLDVCRDVSQLVSRDGAGNPVVIEDAADYVLVRYTFSLQPNSKNAEDPTTPQWYVVDGRTLWETGDLDIPAIADQCPGTIQ